MAFKLTKAENNRREELVASIEIATTPLSAAITEANEAIVAIVASLNEKVAAYNEVLSEARDFAATLVERLQEEFDDKSEKWQEGERAEAASEFIDSWTSIADQLEDVEDFEFDGFDDFDPDHRDTLENASDGS